MDRRKDCGLALWRWARAGVEQAEGEKIDVAGVTGEAEASEDASLLALEHEEADRDRLGGVLKSIANWSIPAVARVVLISSRKAARSSSRLLVSLAIAQGR